MSDNLSETPYKLILRPDGVQAIYRFENSYGASVVRHKYSYGADDGLFELAVLLFEDDNWTLTYDTSVTDDVIGNLSIDEVNETLNDIKELA